mmetsp:Transcript_7485/g.15260  ORF Transcript_7485/g.15260 Transcript_7485/m.15260 type:complete len:108 (-) Transcript_7485:471-794(-)
MYDVEKPNDVRVLQLLENGNFPDRCGWYACAMKKVAVSVGRDNPSHVRIRIGRQHFFMFPSPHHSPLETRMIGLSYRSEDFPSTSSHAPSSSCSRRIFFKAMTSEVT